MPAQELPGAFVNDSMDLASTVRTEEVKQLYSLSRVNHMFYRVFSPLLWQHVSFSRISDLAIEPDDDLLPHIRTISMRLDYQASQYSANLDIVLNFLHQLPSLQYFHVEFWGFRPSASQNVDLIALKHSAQSRLTRALADRPVVSGTWELAENAHTRVFVRHNVRTLETLQDLSENSLITLTSPIFPGPGPATAVTNIRIDDTVFKFPAAPSALYFDSLPLPTSVRLDVSSYRGNPNFTELIDRIAPRISHLRLGRLHELEWAHCLLSNSGFAALQVLSVRISSVKEVKFVCEMLTRQSKFLNVLEFRVESHLLGFFLFFFEAVSGCNRNIDLPMLKRLHLCPVGSWEEDSFADRSDLADYIKKVIVHAWPRNVTNPIADSSFAAPSLGVRKEHRCSAEEWIRRAESADKHALLPFKEDLQSILAGWCFVRGVDFRVIGAKERDFVYEPPAIVPSAFESTEYPYTDSEDDDWIWEETGSSDDWESTDDIEPYGTESEDSEEE